MTGTVPHSLPGHTERINALAVDRQGLRALSASADRTARVWSLFSGTCEAVLAGHGDKSAGEAIPSAQSCVQHSQIIVEQGSPPPCVHATVYVQAASIKNDGNSIIG